MSNDQLERLKTNYPDPAYAELLGLEEFKMLVKDQPELVDVFIRKPNWLEYLKQHQGLIKELANKLSDSKDSDHKEWNELIKEGPEWAMAFAYELEEINKRRNKSSTPLVKENLIGISFSGGGIRSASFGLGVLEGLRESNILSKIDYLSTVSGGGYIGAWLSAHCKRAAEDKEESKRDWLAGDNDVKKHWDESIKHLRRYSNYLSPKVGLLSADSWTMATVWLRNTALMQLTVVLGLACLLMIPRFLFSAYNYEPPIYDKWENNSHYVTWIFIIIFYIIFVGGLVDNLRLINTPTNNKASINAKNKFESLTAGFVFLAVGLDCVSIFSYEFFPDPNAMGQKWFFATFCIVFLFVFGGSKLVPPMISFSRTYITSFFRYISQKRTSQKPAEPPSTNKNEYSQTDVLGFIILPLLAFSFLVADILWKETIDLSHWIKKYSPHEINSNNKLIATSYYHFLLMTGYKLAFPLIVVFFSLMGLMYSSFKDQKEKKTYLYRLQNFLSKNHNITFIIIGLSKRIGFILVTVIVTLVLCALIAAVMQMFNSWKDHHNQGGWQAFVWGLPILVMAFSFSWVILIGLLGILSNESVREWWSRLNAWLAISGLIWITICGATVYGSYLGEVLLNKNYLNSTFLGGGWIGTTILGVLAGKSTKTGGASSSGLMSKSLEIMARIAPIVFIIGLLVFTSTLLNHIFVEGFDKNHLTQNTGLLLDQNNFENHSKNLFEEPSDKQFKWIGLVCLVLFLLLTWRVDINEFSFSSFYRIRLTRCYLGATRWNQKRNPQDFTGFDDADDLKLFELVTSKPKELKGPLHILNCAMNLGGSSDLTVHTRLGTIFTLTPLFCGSSYKIKAQSIQHNDEEVGYRATNRYFKGEEQDQLSLGQAMAVSGAAANPNMGYNTSPAAAFLMTLFNVRLGCWFPSPHKPKVEDSSPVVSLKYLFKELFGLANEKSDYLSISDGGHFENLAAYELIKRNCKVIIISDAECDPDYQFEGLGNLIRICEVDFGAEITIEVSSNIKPNVAGGWSALRYAIGKIKYKDGNDGVLIYIKASMTGKEDTAVMQYKWSHQSFPHETTGNQFYKEDQFESYRSLGYEITMDIFKNIPKNDNNAETLTKDKAISSARIIKYAKKLYGDKYGSNQFWPVNYDKG